MMPMIRYAKRWIPIMFAGLVGSTTLVAMAEDLPANHPRLTQHGAAFSPRMFQVDQGAKQEAEAYYLKLSEHIGLGTPTTILTITLADLLAYLGYPEITAADLHAQTSQELMARGTGDEILAIRFFAPKITSVSEKPVVVPDGGFGWRKVVRLIARPGSPALAKGIGMGYILQNIFSKDAADDPFDGEHVSNFNQVILTRSPGSGDYTPDHRSAYFMTFDPFVVVDKDNVPVKVGDAYQSDGKLSFSLGATFDEKDRNPETNLGASEYFVPAACEACHGGSVEFGKVNFLDTDHWFDRVFPSYGLPGAQFSEEDFTGMAQSPFGLLYDGGTDVTSAQFKTAFAVIRKFNEGTAVQNADVGPQSFQKLAVEKWLTLHEASLASAEAHVPPIERGIGPNTWNAATPGDKELVYYLNRYCYRCHSSVAYSVYDRETVTTYKGLIRRKVLELTRPDKWMPQDRIFPGLGTKQGEAEAVAPLLDFLNLVGALQ